MVKHLICMLPVLILENSCFSENLFLLFLFVSLVITKQTHLSYTYE
jgi:hypothetical protein